MVRAGACECAQPRIVLMQTGKRERRGGMASRLDDLDMKLIPACGRPRGAVNGDLNYTLAAIQAVTE